MCPSKSEESMAEFFVPGGGEGGGGGGGDNFMGNSCSAYYSICYLTTPQIFSHQNLVKSPL